MAFGKKEPIRWYNFWVCFAVAIGTVAFGYPSAIIAPTLGKTAFLEYMGLGDADGVYHSKQGLTGAITGVFQAGAVIGVLLNCEIMDRWGRKTAMLTSAIVSIIGAVGLCAAQNIGMFIAFRFFTGAGSFAFLAITPVYTSELAPPAYRGFFGGMVGVMLGLGYASASYFGLAFSFQSSGIASWRVPLGLGIFWPSLIVCILPFVPESPRYLLMVDKHDEARKVVEKLHNDPNDPDNEFVRSEFYQMHKQISFDRTVDSSWKHMFTKPSYRKRSIYAMAFTFFTQSTAVLVINNYGPTFYAELGFNARDRLILQSGRDSIAFVGNILGAVLMDRLGRRLLILGGFTGAIVCLCIEAAMVALYTGTAAGAGNKAGLGVGICALYVYLVFYAAGIDAAGFVWLSEIFPNAIRSKGLALAIAMYSLSDVVYLSVTPMAFARIGWKFFLVFIVLSAIGWVWLYFTLQETNGLPLEEIAALFGDQDEVMVYTTNIKVNHNTHKLVVRDEESEISVKHVGTEVYKPNAEQKESA